MRQCIVAYQRPQNFRTTPAWQTEACPPVLWGCVGQGPCPVRCGPQVRPGYILRATPVCTQISWVIAGLCHRSSCHTFKPRSSSPRLCRKARSQSLSCTATSAARPTQPGQPTAIHRAAATILSFWQHSLKQVAGFVRRQPTQMDSAVCKVVHMSDLCN